MCHRCFILLGVLSISAFEIHAAEPANPAPAANNTGPSLEISPASKTKQAVSPAVQPATKENLIVYKQGGRYGGWPANHGLWQWGDELVVGFTSTWYRQTTTDHRIDRTKPVFRHKPSGIRACISSDGGITWEPEIMLREDGFDGTSSMPSLLSH